MAHGLGDKAYSHDDKSQMLDEHREFMVQQCYALAKELIT
ncbi:hypothetical protein PMIT1303_00503 [Prochlorococcus sp. MIT 1303]|nr:hypothetical protein PMIT1303_00503 [Prochlorococcus sp. MIT 1303]